MKKKAMLLMAKKGEAQQEIARNALMEADEPAEGDISDKAKKPAESNSVAVPADRESLKSQSSDNVTGFDEELLLDFELPEWLQELADDLEVPFLCFKFFSPIFWTPFKRPSMQSKAVLIKVAHISSCRFSLPRGNSSRRQSSSGGPRYSARITAILLWLEKLRSSSRPGRVTL